MKTLIAKGPSTYVLVFSKTCPHCVTYMPIWDSICKAKTRTANMVSVEASNYQNTELAAKKPVSGVPTVLKVSTDGTIEEVEEPRNEDAMIKAVSVSVKHPLHLLPAEPVQTAYGTEMEEQINNDLLSSQSGGSPWAAFLTASRQAKKRPSIRKRKTRRRLKLTR